MTPRPRAKSTAPVLLAPERYPSQAAYRAARAASWVHLIRNGMTMTDVGHKVGISRERVRQILRKEGYHEREGMQGKRPPVYPDRVAAALRDEWCRDLRGLAHLAGCTEPDARRVLHELDLWETARRLWKHRAKLVTPGADGYGREAIIAALQAFHARYARTPSIGDATAGLVPFGKTTVIRRFGRWNKAIVAAGLEPRRVPGRRRAR